MMNKLSGWDDTIVAMATPPGIGAIGVIRLSGNSAIDIINKLFPSKDLSIQSSHTLHVGYLKDEDKVLDESVISIYKNPTSYTGEDVVEISCHGSAYVQQQLVQSIINKGARLAKAGEFTQRAFLNGKLDLAQAEAVADIIASNTEASKNAALNNMRGGFSEVLKELREQLIQFSSLIELELDFSEEDVEFADRKKFVELIIQISTSTKKLLDSFKLGNVVKNGVSVAIVGKPNAGKSTLLNTLLNDNRAIVSEIAGTTRDTIEEIININGILFRLIDTAGIREHTTDVIENMGVIKSLEKIKEADIVLYLFDVNTTGKDELQIIKENLSDPASYQDKQLILVGNKSDIIKAGKIKNNYDDLPVQFISAKENTGIEELKNKLYLSVTENKTLTENIIVTNTRHYEALQQIERSLIGIKKGLENKISGDLLALDIRHCLHYLGEITGEITNEDRLDYIFSKFCIGK
ncbi:MAG: tRNA uridine-5-carboxymethylaminomethyl(34) synthesis GTPase MnmE [Chitinophagaceae bacterium]|nr:tRNA uridine-5-carboxymethylaminomethyl(34) synthesis GTPase MnmE [Chitinophagaceae bacterium]